MEMLNKAIIIIVIVIIIIIIIVVVVVVVVVVVIIIIIIIKLQPLWNKVYMYAEMNFLLPPRQCYSSTQWSPGNASCTCISWISICSSTSRYIFKNILLLNNCCCSLYFLLY